MTDNTKAFSPTFRKKLGLGPKDPIPTTLQKPQVQLDMLSIRMIQEMAEDGAKPQQKGVSASSFVRSPEKEKPRIALKKAKPVPEKKEDPIAEKA